MNRRTLSAALVALAFSAIAPATRAADESQVRTVGDFVIYIGLVPSEMILGHRLAPEMHGGVPAGEHVYHVLIAVFDRKTGERVKDLEEITARVADVHGATPTKKLESMLFGSEIGFGNYFDLPRTGPYRVVVRLTRRGAQPIETEFEIAHVRV